MEMDTQVATVTSNAVFTETRKMTVSNEAMGHITDLLSNMYTDSYKAIAREYLSNAYDASVRAMNSDSAFGIVLEKPIEVTLPSRLNPTFVVKDHGTGMTRQILMDVYPMYGESTKRQDNTEIGGFGLGAKSAFAEATNFIVTTVHDGKKNTAIFQKDEDGENSANFLEEVDTTEENGTVVTVTLPDPDRLNRIFQDSNLLLGFPHGSILVNGRMHTNSVYNTDVYTEVDGKGWILNTLLNWENARPSAIQKGYNQKVVLVGPIAYTFNRSELDGSEYSRDFAKLDDYTVVNLSIGSVKVTPSRDNLIFNKRTKDSITAGTAELKAAVDTIINTKLATAVDRRAAVDIVESLRIAGFNGEWEYNGEVIPDSTFKVADGTHASFTGQGSTKTRLANAQGYATTRNTLLVHSIADKDEFTAVNRYRRAYETEHPGLPDSFRLVMTTMTAEQVGNWLPAYAHSAMSVAEFVEQGIAHRKAAREAKRALNTTPSVARGTVNYGSTPVSVLDLTNLTQTETRPVVSVKSAAQVTATNVVYLRSDTENADTFAHKMAEAAVGRSGGQVRSLNRILSAVKTHYGNDVSVVRVSNSIKMSTFLNAIPHAVSMDDAVALVAANPAYSPEVYAISQCNTFMSNRNRYWNTTSKNNTGWVKDLDLAEINDEKVREWVGHAQKFEELNYDARYTFNLFVQLVKDDSVFRSLFTDFLAKANEVKDYNLRFLASLDNHGPATKKDIIEYLNFKYPVAQ
jgi:hypothetical protein